MVKQVWVVVKMAEWWLGPTTPDQCGENPAISLSSPTALQCLYDYTVASCIYSACRYFNRQKHLRHIESTTSVEDMEIREMKEKLKFHFMNPFQKWRYEQRRRFPWKLIVQLTSMFLVTLQVSAVCVCECVCVWVSEWERERERERESVCTSFYKLFTHNLNFHYPSVFNIWFVVCNLCNPHPSSEKTPIKPWNVLKQLTLH